MSLRDRILAEVSRARLPGATADQITDAIMAHVAADSLDGPLLGAPTGIDQGVTRLELVGFMSGRSGSWNGAGDSNWVRYRGHHVDRDLTSDGVFVRFTFRDHAGTECVESWSAGQRGKYALAVLGKIDALLDIVIEHHGVSNEEILDAAIAEPIGSREARRVLHAWWKWVTSTNACTPEMTNTVNGFTAAIDAGEVTP